MVRLKVIFIFLFILWIPVISNGQNFKAQVSAGLNVAQVDGDSYGGYNQPGLLLGFSILKKQSPKLDYGFEMLLSQKGSHKKTSEDDPQTFKLRYNYICLPLFVDFKELGEHMKRVHIRLAISNNINFTSKVDYGFGWQENSIKRWELSGYLGVGYQINDKIGFMLRSENSLLSVGVPSANTFYKVNRNGLYNRLVSFVLTANLN
jgi:hypothetical protein